MNILKNFEISNISIIFLLSDHILHPTFNFSSTAILTLSIIRYDSNSWFPKTIINNPFLAYGIFLALDSVFRATFNYSVASLFNLEFYVLLSFFKTIKRDI